ncbi:ferritin-like domain-containing protein [Hymenobacter sp. BT664]|uniref:Ferritin-like domain-containing protein n=1 Tax=Hymenobacter montanus TaxID=2771359 RepID=A0A927BAD8_9BACT|nr:ferritin-like domain-containing protein [Hymenobacter montanus]MBD2767092.1 ferritin-like domain-containing protein [Hymenobacter montanus]
MDLFKIFSEIEKIDGEVYERFDTRRRVFKHLTGLGKTITAATMPALLSTMFNKAYGQTSGLSPEIKNTLNLALQLEYLEFHFYDTALNTPDLIPASDRPAVTIIRDDELGHINAIKGLLSTDAIPDPTRLAFDYTAGGRLAPFSSSAEFYGTAQGFVDTGMRAYKGGATKLMPNKDILTAALNIHSVEARHSAHVRLMRRVLAGSTNGGDIAGGPGNANPKSWISLTERDGPRPSVTAPVYGPGNTTDFPGEDNVQQGGKNVQTTATYPTIPGVTLTDAMKAAAASEAFDEPLDDGTVKSIARNFRSPLGERLGLFA